MRTYTGPQAIRPALQNLRVFLRKMEEKNQVTTEGFEPAPCNPLVLSI